MQLVLLLPLLQDQLDHRMELLALPQALVLLPTDQDQEPELPQALLAHHQLMAQLVLLLLVLVQDTELSADQEPEPPPQLDKLAHHMDHLDRLVHLTAQPVQPPTEQPKVQAQAQEQADMEQLVLHTEQPAV